MKTPVIPPTEAFKVSGTISASGANVGLSGIANASIILKNDSSVALVATFIGAITNFDIIDSVFIDSQFINVPNGRINFSKTIPAKSSSTIGLKIVLKKNLTPEQSVNGKVCVMNIDSLSYNNVVSKPANLSANIFVLQLNATAFINVMASYASSSTATDTFVVGKSVAEGFSLLCTNPGTALVEIIGRKNDGGNPISHYWITNSTDEDFGVRVSNFNSSNNVLVPKTAVNNFTFTINLVAGVNNVVFKTTALKGLIPNGSKVGLKITLANGVSFISTYSAFSDSVDVADKVAVMNVWQGGASFNVGENIRKIAGSFIFFPLNTDNSFNNNFPKIVSAGISTDFYVKKYPFLDFTNKGKSSFIFDYYNPITQIGFDIFNNNKFDNSKNIVTMNDNDKAYNLIPNPVFPESKGMTLYINVYNNSQSLFAPGSIGLEAGKGGWKFWGNPEMEIRVNTNGSGSSNYLPNVPTKSYILY